MSMQLTVAIALFLGAVTLAIAQNSPDDNSQKQTQSQGQIGYKSTQDADQRSGGRIKNADPICRPVRRRQLALVGARRCYG